MNTKEKKEQEKKKRSKKHIITIKLGYQLSQRKIILSVIIDSRETTKFQL